MIAPMNMSVSDLQQSVSLVNRIILEDMSLNKERCKNRIIAVYHLIAGTRPKIEIVLRLYLKLFHYYKSSTLPDVAGFHINSGVDKQDYKLKIFLSIMQQIEKALQETHISDILILLPSKKIKITLSTSTRSERKLASEMLSSTPTSE